ncbi:MAG TPA: glycosyltransferase family 39 protein, partial [Acidimicrobiia bacterium]|nr:glycosyltransferase family 39 protein [Acidimicrobiia bacterium]
MTTGTLESPAAPVVVRSRWPFVAAVYGLSRLVAFAGFGVTVLVRAGWSLGDLPRLWDGLWYLRLAHDGYPHGLPEVAGRAQGTLAFFPLFPLLIRVVSALPGVSDGVAGLAVSLASGAAAAWFVSRLAERLAGERAARRATVLFCFFPGSIVFSMVYSEGLMIALAAATLLALVDRRWILAGALGGLATACRPNAAVLVVAAGWAAIEAVRRGGDRRALVAPALMSAGIGGFMSFLWLRTGVPDAWIRVEHDVWNQQADFGRTLINWTAWFVRAPFGNLERAMVVAALVFAAAGLWFVVRRGWPAPVAVYTAGTLALAAAYRVDVLRPRAVLAAFPLFIA